MKKFDIITEADARVLERGTTVELARGGHVTPLAQDTLRERRIVVTAEGRTQSDHARLPPASAVRSVAVGSDSAGRALGGALVALLRSRGLAVDDQVIDGSGIGEYPEVAARVARSVSAGEADAGIVVDAAGVGSAIVANKIPGIRAVMAPSEMIARYSREHCGANVLTLGAAFLAPDEATAIVIAWLTTTMRDAGAIERLARVRDLEQR